MPDFRSPEFLLGHIRHTLAFYDARCVDASGGFFQFFKDDGTVYDRRTRHLVSSTRFVFNHAMAWRRFGIPGYQERVRCATVWPSCSAPMRSRRAAMRGSSTGTKAAPPCRTAPTTATASPSCCSRMRMR